MKKLLTLTAITITFITLLTGCSSEADNAWKYVKKNLSSPESPTVVSKTEGWWKEYVILNQETNETVPCIFSTGDYGTDGTMDSYASIVMTCDWRQRGTNLEIPETATVNVLGHDTWDLEYVDILGEETVCLWHQRGMKDALMSCDLTSSR